MSVQKKEKDITFGKSYHQKETQKRVSKEKGDFHYDDKGRLLLEEEQWGIYDKGFEDSRASAIKELGIKDNYWIDGNGNLCWRQKIIGKLSSIKRKWEV